MLKRTLVLISSILFLSYSQVFAVYVSIEPSETIINV